MARQLRIEYSGAWYHVMNRGINRKFIFYSDIHRNIFISLLQKIVRIFDIEIHAFCLMGNHYHLLLHTPFPNLSKAMRYLNGVYTQKLNKIENRDGPIFRGRYKAILIQDNSYLLNVSRYIHLNPVEAEICKLISDYSWSSYNCYINIPHKTFITTSTLIELSGGIENYVKFIQDGIDSETINFYNQKNISTIFGDKEFIKNSLSKIKVENMQSSPADVKRIKYFPSIEKIIEATANYFKISIDCVTNYKRGQKNYYRLITIYLSKMIGQHSYSAIAHYLNSTSDAIRGMFRCYENECEKNEDIQNIIDLLANSRI